MQGLDSSQCNGGASSVAQAALSDMHRRRSGRKFSSLKQLFQSWSHLGVGRAIYEGAKDVVPCQSQDTRLVCFTNGKAARRVWLMAEQREKIFSVLDGRDVHHNSEIFGQPRLPIERSGNVTGAAAAGGPLVAVGLDYVPAA